MSQDQVNKLSLMSIENEISNALDFEELLDAFAAKKTRKKSIQLNQVEYALFLSNSNLFHSSLIAVCFIHKFKSLVSFA